MKTTVKVSSHIRDKLNTLTESLGYHSVDALLYDMVQSYQGDGEAIGRDSDLGDDMDVGDEDAPYGKLERGLLFSALSGDAKSVKHFTGLKQEPYLWVQNALIDAVCECLFFFFFAARPRALSGVRGGCCQAL